MRRCPESAKARNLLGQTPISLAIRTKRPDTVLVPLVSLSANPDDVVYSGRARGRHILGALGDGGRPLHDVFKVAYTA